LRGAIFVGRREQANCFACGEGFEKVLPHV